MLNILILLSVIRVLFTHLSGNEASDNTSQVKKSVKSLFFLLPLLGITNVLHFVWPNPLRGSWLSFAIWSITSHFLYSFQGVFVASVYFLFDDKVKDTLYKFWVLKVRLRDWGFSNSVNNPSRPGSIHALNTNCRVFEPSNLESERIPMGSLRVTSTSNFDIHSAQSSFKKTPNSSHNSLKKPQLRKVKIPSIKENNSQHQHRLQNNQSSQCKASKVKSPGVEERRQINGKASSTEAEMELRGQIEVHIEPPDNDTTAGSKMEMTKFVMVY